MPHTATRRSIAGLYFSMRLSRGFPHFPTASSKDRGFGWPMFADRKRIRLRRLEVDSR